MRHVWWEKVSFGKHAPRYRLDSDGKENAIYQYLAVFPGLAISVVVLAFNMLGDALRDLLAPRFALTVAPADTVALSGGGRLVLDTPWRSWP